MAHSGIFTPVAIYAILVVLAHMGEHQRTDFSRNGERKARFYVNTAFGEYGYYFQVKPLTIIAHTLL
jgi:hypothetical protein